MKNFLKNDWEFNILNIYNYNKPGSFSSYFDFIKKNHKKLPGDLLEAGVHKGKSLLSVALFLKEIGSKKKSMDMTLGLDFLKIKKIILWTIS